MGQNLYRSQGVRNKQIYRLLGKVPTIAAAIYRHRAGRYDRVTSRNFLAESYY